MFHTLFETTLFNVVLMLPLFATRQVARLFPAVNGAEGWRRILGSEPFLCAAAILLATVTGMLLLRWRGTAAGATHLLIANALGTALLWVVIPILQGPTPLSRYIQELWAVGNALLLVCISLMFPFYALRRLLSPEHSRR